MADSVERLEFDIYARDRGAKRTFDEVARGADKAGDSFGGLGKDATALDRHISDTETHLKSLIEEFERTEDITIFRQFKRDKSELATLKAMRKEVEAIADKAEAIEQQAQGSSGGFLSSLPASPVLIGSLVALGAAAAPSIGAAIGGAVLGGVGVGGIIGGIAAASQDEAVAAAAKGVGRRFVEGLTAEAAVFDGPLLSSLSILERAGNSFNDSVGGVFRELAPLTVDLAHGVEGFSHAIGPGLEKAAKASEPVVRVLSQELPELGSAVSDALGSISDSSDGATMGFITLLHATEDIIRGGGEFVGWLAGVFDWLVRTGTEVTDFAVRIIDLVAWTEKIPVIGKGIQLTSGYVRGLNDETTSIIDGFNQAKSSTGTFVGKLSDLFGGLVEVTSETDALRTSLTKYSETIDDAFSPTDRLIHRLRDVREAQATYNEAVRDHGRNSQEAKDANLKVAEAILAANGAAAAAAGTFNGKLDPALIKILRDGGATEDQIRDIGRQFTDAQRRGEAFAKDYRARLILEQQQTHREDARQYRAMGGPAMANQSYVVGENGPEILEMGSSSGYVHNAAASRAMASAGAYNSAPAARQAIDVNISIDPSGAFDELAQAFLKMLRVNPGFRATAKSYLEA